MSYYRFYDCSINILNCLHVYNDLHEVNEYTFICIYSEMYLLVFIKCHKI